MTPIDYIAPGYSYLARDKDVRCIEIYSLVLEIAIGSAYAG